MQDTVYARYLVSYYRRSKMAVITSTSLLPSVTREFCLLLLVMLFASTPFVAAQAEENPIPATQLISPTN